MNIIKYKINISRKKNYLLSSSLSFINTVVLTISGIVSVPIAMNYWNRERYGLWTLLISFVLYLNMSNFGLNSAASFLTAKCGSTKIKIKILTRSALLIIVITAISGVMFLGLTRLFPGWIAILGKIPSNLLAEGRATASIMILGFLINLPFSIVSSGLNGFQRQYIDTFFSIIGNIVLFVNLIIIISIHGTLSNYALLNSTTTLIINCLRLIAFKIYVQRKNKIFSDCELNENITIETISESGYKTIIAASLRFFVISTASLVVWNTDNLVISNIIGINAVVPYSVTLKLYSVCYNFVFLFNNALLPLLGQAFAEDNWDWINRVYRVFLIIESALGGLIWVGGIVLVPSIIHIWTGPTGYAGLPTIVFLGMYSYLLSMVSLNSGLISSFNYLKRTTLVSWIEAILKITISIILTKIIGIAGVAIGTVIGSLFGPSILSPIILVRRSKGKLIYNKKYVFKHFFFAIIPCVAIGITIQIIFRNDLTIATLFGTICLFVYIILSILIMPREALEFIKQQILLPFIKRSNKAYSTKE